ncbi:DUF932 domain-containing protein [Streptomyces sp. NPDC050095]|uniref:DUF932 domain-containing protein n=1 Tax=unclassified Streptomyces TaxID=2593676 RepID=UPI003424D40E
MTIASPTANTVEIPAASLRVQPWKLLGDHNQIGAPTWNAAREAAGLTWEPTEQRIPRCDENGHPIVTGLDDEGRPVYEVEADYKRLTRGRGGKTLGIVGDGYGVITHEALGRLIDPVLDVPGTTFEHLVELNEGRKIFGLVKIGDDTVLPGDFSPTTPYLAFTTSHDGGGALRVWGTATRWICTNQMAASEATGRKKGMHATIRHTSLWQLRTEKVHELVAQTRNQFGMISSLFDELSHIRIDGKVREAFVRNYFPMPIGAEATDRAIKATESKRETLRALFEMETNAPLMGSALGLAQSAIEWADHLRRAESADSMLHRNVIRPQDMKLRAWKMARNAVSLAA